MSQRKRSLLLHCWACGMSIMQTMETLINNDFSITKNEIYTYFYTEDMIYHHYCKTHPTQVKPYIPLQPFE